MKKKDWVKTMCELCKHIPCIVGCPNYIPSKADYYCSVCKYGIYEGDTYVENINGEYIHRDCLNCTNETLNDLRIKMHIMGENL